MQGERKELLVRSSLLTEPLGFCRQASLVAARSWPDPAARYKISSSCKQKDKDHSYCYVAGRQSGGGQVALLRKEETCSAPTQVAKVNFTNSGCSRPPNKCSLPGSPQSTVEDDEKELGNTVWTCPNITKDTEGRCASYQGPAIHHAP